MNCTTNPIHPSTSCNNSDGMLKMIILAKEDVSIAKGSGSEHAAMTKATWETLVQAEDIIPIPVAISTDPTNEGAIYEQTPLGSMWVRDGRMEVKYNINTNMDLHSKLRSLNGSEYTKAFYVYNSGMIYGTQTTGETAFDAYELALMHVEYHTDNDGSVGGKTPIFLSFEDAREFQDYPKAFQPTWNPLKLKALTNVQLEVVSASATSIVVRAYVPHIKEGYKNPVEGLVVGDWLSTTTAGVVETISSSTENLNVPGEYTLAGTGLATGFINMKKPSLMTTKGFKSVGAVAKTVA